ncbi:MAG: alpha/beta fold hydrolase [Caulobacteraceae bacterium]
MQISPNGELLAFVRTDGDQRTIVIQRTDQPKLVASLAAGATKLRRLRWADDRHLLITVSTTARVQDIEGSKREWFIVSSFDVVTGKQIHLLDGAGDAMNVVVGGGQVRAIGGKTYVFLQTYHFAHSEGTLGLFRVELASGYASLVEPGMANTEDWFVDRDGRAVAEVRYISSQGRWTLDVRRPDGRWVNSQAVQALIETPSVEGYARDGESLLVSTSENGKSVLHTVSLKDGAWGPGQDNAYDWITFDATSHAFMGGFTLDGDEERADFFDPAVADIWRAIVKAVPGERVDLVSWSANHRKVVVLLDGPRDGYGYALVDLDAKGMKWIGDVYPGIAPDQIAQPKAIAYKAADGLSIPAYLTLPLGRAAKGLPLVVMPHGGPADRDTLEFDWLREALVSRGYAVLQPNFRGSSGYGDAFLQAGYGQWGRKMQTDLSDGVRFLASEGIVDPKRACIFGWSYGGYAALAGAAIDKGVYRCAADMAGPADLSLMLRGSGTISRRYWDRFMGAKGADDPALDQISPARLAANIDIPVLIVHGKDDTVVDYNQSEAMAAALGRAGKPYALVTLDGEDHWGSRGETRQKLLRAVVDFLAKNNPPAP